ncbi:MAG: ribonuclease P protein component [Acidiferrobacter sp.]
MVPGQETFPRGLRLTDPKHYQQVFKTGRRGRHPTIGIVAVPNGLDHPRLGLAVSRKVSRKAVIRNRIKRTMREFFRREQQRLCALDFVVVAYPEAAQATHAELTEALMQLSQKMCRICAKP